MFGQPGRNTRLWLDFFEQHAETHHVTLVCRSQSRCRGDGTDMADYPRIDVVEIEGKRSFLTLCRVLRHRYDLVLIQGLYGYRLEAAVFLLSRARRRAVQIWNPRNYRRCDMSKSRLERACLSRMLSAADAIIFSWYANRDVFAGLFPRWADKAAVFPWGIPARYTHAGPSSGEGETSPLLQGVAEDSLLVFWPRAFGPANRHDLLLDALPVLREALPAGLWRRTRFVLVGGNPGYDEHQARLREKVAALDDTDHLRWHEDFVPFDMLLPVWRRAGILLNLADDDQLSTAINLAGLHGLVPILSDIPAYRHLVRIGFDAVLVQNTVDSVAAALCETIGKVAGGERVCELERNRKLMLEKFDSDKNFAAIIAHCLHPERAIAAESPAPEPI